MARIFDKAQFPKPDKHFHSSSPGMPTKDHEKPGAGTSDYVVSYLAIWQEGLNGREGHMSDQVETQRPAPSHIYYFSIGSGTWRGKFTFRVLSWRSAYRERIGLKNAVLVAAMTLMQSLLGPAALRSTITAHPESGEFGKADNIVILTKLGVTVYNLEEVYVLDPDGTSVAVFARERFGPVPRILTRNFEYRAEIHAGGLSSTYHMPLLGSPWILSYRVSDDHNRLDGELTCSWAEAREEARRVMR